MGADTSDTLDLVARADLAINCLTRCTNPENDYACYVYVDLNRRPPVGKYQIRFYGKFMESLALMRRVTGSDVNLHVDRAWHDGIMQAWTASLATLDEPHIVMHNPEGGRQFAWLAGLWQDTGDVRYRDLGELAIEHALKAATHQDDYCYFGPPYFGPPGPPYFGPPDGMPLGWAATMTGWTVQGVSRYYAATGSGAALELATKLARYVKDHAEIFDEDGQFIARHDSPAPHAMQFPSTRPLGPALHFHHNANALHGLLEYGLAAADAEHVDFARRGYTYARSTGSPLVGFFPEYIDDWPDARGVVDCEGCCVADMIQLALRLTLSGAGDYWDDVDRYVRNQFAQMQMRSSDWVYRMIDGYGESPVGPAETADQVPERCVGGFGGWTTANDFFVGVGNGMMNCCTGNCSRALYYVWENVAEVSDDELRVNLLLDRSLDAAEIVSKLPHEGRVSIRAKRALESVAVRTPEWIGSGNDYVSCEVNRVTRPVACDGRYARVVGVASGDTVTFDFPIADRAVNETIGAVDYSLVVRGNTVTSISPAGENSPFYTENA